MNRKHVAEDLVTITVPRSALTVVEPTPLTVTQRTCLKLFSLSKDDYLRLAGRAFAVKKIGKLRIARYADVAAYLTSDQERQTPVPAVRLVPAPPANRPQVTAQPPPGVDYEGILRKAGFGPRKKT